MSLSPQRSASSAFKPASFIRQCASIQEVIPEASPRTFVVFDIDNTLLRPLQMLGSDEWFNTILDSAQPFLSHEEALQSRRRHFARRV